MELPKGTKIKNGEYIIQKKLGQGGFGITYLASARIEKKGNLKSMTVKADVVVKEFFLKDYCTREENDSVTVASKGMTEMVGKYREKFKKEAIKLSQMSHPNIVEVTDVIEDENNTSYYVMKYLSGGTLYQQVCSNTKVSKPLSEEDAVRYIKQVASALGYMHKKSMCHFDVKPNNIMLDEDGNAVLIDFGLAKNYTKEGEQTSTLISGASVGYAPLEQANANLETFSPQTDIYALGATLYFLLTGHAPKAAAFNLSEVLPKGQCGISDNLWDVIKRCMQANPEDRPQDIESFLCCLEGKEIEEPDGGNKTDEYLGDNNDSPETEELSKEKNKLSIVVLKKITTIKLLLFSSLFLGTIGLYYLLAELSKRNEEMSHIIIPKTQTFQIERMILPDTILLPDYFSAAPFSEGLAKVSYGGDCGYIDTLGQLEIPFLFNDAQSFSEGLAAAKSKNDKWGYINKKGKIVIPFIYDYAFPFEGGHAIVELDGKRGIIKKDGKFLIKPNCKYVQISDSYILTGANGKWSCFDITGNLLFDLNGYEEIGEINSDMLPVKKDILHRKISDWLYEANYKWGVVDKWGKVRIDFIYDDIYSFYENRAVVKKGNKYGYIDRDGNIIVPPYFDEAYSYEDGMAKVKKGDKFGFVNLQGDLVIDTLYSNAYNFREGLAKVKISGKWGVVNKKGEEVIPFYYDDVEDGSSDRIYHRDITAFYSGLLPVKMGEKWGFINQKGEIVIDFNYDKVLSSSFEGYSIVLKGDKFFVINLSM